MVYCQNGIVASNVDECTTAFYIEELSEKIYYYPNDNIFDHLYNHMSWVHDAFIEQYFSNHETFYSIQKSLPAFVSNLGLCSSSPLTKNDFEECINQLKNKAPEMAQTINRMLYFHDVDFILESIQNLLLGMNRDFMCYFIFLCDIKAPKDLSDGDYETMSEETSYLSSMLASYFIRLGSILDLITKLWYEYENLQTDFTKYNKLKSSSILYGQKQRIKRNDTKYTLFLKDAFIKEIESIRNEVVHNGCWEHTPRVFLKITNKKVVERYMLYPDIEDGLYTRYGNRYHFFGKTRKVNDVLPTIHFEFIKRLTATIYLLYNPTASESSIENAYTGKGW